MKNTKWGTIIKGFAIGIPSFALLLAIGGYVTPFIVFATLFDHHQSYPQDLNGHEYAAHFCQKDYPELARRSTFNFPGSQGNLIGYLYEVISPKGIVIHAHGMGSLADGFDAALEAAYLNLGYDVFAFDLTGSGRSEGESMVGLHQSKYDIASAVSFIHSLDSVQNLDITLSGHSWGGYGALTSINLVEGVSSVIAFSAFERPYDLMFASARKNIGFLADVSEPLFALSASTRFQGEEKVRASSLLSSCQQNVMLFQGEEDEVVPLAISAFAAVSDLARPNIERVLLPGVGHQTPWLDPKSIAYSKKNKSLWGEESYDLKKASIFSETVYSHLASFLG